MGYYINPTDGSQKEDWLEKHGVKTTVDAVLKHDFASSKLPVCWVRNPGFSAAGIGYDPREVEAFNWSEDPRPKQWYLVEKEDLKPWYKEKTK